MAGLDLVWDQATTVSIFDRLKAAMARATATGMDPKAVRVNASASKLIWAESQFQHWNGLPIEVEPRGPDEDWLSPPPPRVTIRAVDQDGVAHDFDG